MMIAAFPPRPALRTLPQRGDKPEGKVEKLWKAVVPPTLRVVGAPLASLISLGGATWEKVHPPKPSPPHPPSPNLLQSQANVELQRPFLLVPGFNYDLKAFNDLTGKLTEGGRNGGQVYYLRQGKVYLDSHCGQEVPRIPSEARVFVASFDHRNDPPQLSAPQLARNFTMIQQATGTDKVDVAAHSMGGLATRRYLDEGGHQVGHFLMVGTPNQGASLARASLKLLDYSKSGWPVGWILHKKTLVESDRPAYEWLQPAASGTPLGALNERSRQQRSRVEEGLIIGADSLKTYGQALWKVGGDGTVPAPSLHLEGWPSKILTNAQIPKHGELLRDPQVYKEMTDFFGWGKS